MITHGTIVLSSPAVQELCQLLNAGIVRITYSNPTGGAPVLHAAADGSDGGYVLSGGAAPLITDFVGTIYVACPGASTTATTTVQWVVWDTT